MRPTLDEYYTAMLPLVASSSTCPRRQVACIITDTKGRMVAMGYPGQIAGMAHCVDSPCSGAPAVDGERTACEATHAELNAVLQAEASKRTPYTAYCSLTPCKPCAQALAGLGVREVIALEAYKYDDSGPRLLNKAGVPVWLYNGGARTPWNDEATNANIL